MGVRGLLSYVLRHRDKGTTQKVDLVEEARSRGHGGVTLLVDLVDFVGWLLPQVHQCVKECAPDLVPAACGGEFAHLDEALSALVFGLREVGVHLEFFVDPPGGHGLVDAVVAGNWESEAKKRAVDHLETAKAIRQWCRGEKDRLPERLDEKPCLPSLWYEQVRASLERCGSHVWCLSAEEQTPLLSLSRNSGWGYVWGVVSDSIDWAVVRGVRLVPLSCFDADGDLRPLPSLCLHGGWPQAMRLSVQYTTCELLAEQLRLGHPPREDELAEAASGKGKGKGKGPIGFGRWPWKWWFDQALPELALLLGTDATTPHLQRHKLYAQLGLYMGADPVDSIVRWVRNQLYSNKLRWRDVRLEALSPLLAKLAAKDQDFALALKSSRAVYSQDVGGLREVSSELARRGAELPGAGAGAAELPEAASLFLRSAALAGRAALDVACEDVARNGAPLAHQLLGDLRRLAYGLAGRKAVVELGVSGEQRGSIQSNQVALGSDELLETLQGVQHESLVWRRLFFTKVLQHNLLQKEGATAPEASGEAAAEGQEPLEPELKPVEAAVLDAYKAAPEAPNAEVAEMDFLQAALQYFVSLNLRQERPMIRQHEFDSVVAMVALCWDACLPGSILVGAHEWMQQRLGEVRATLIGLFVSNFHESAEVRPPIRAAALGAWFQGAVGQLLDVCRLLWLDCAEGDTPAMFLPEPRELYCGTLLAALYMAGAYDQWELRLPQSDSQWRWQGLLKRMSELRQEVVRAPVFGRWKKRLLDGLPRGTVSWPSHQQLQAEIQKCGAAADELPIDEHREKILQHIEDYRVTCIQGETGCGKSTRVPVYVMENYFEQKKKGKIKSDDTFMVLCTQPRRIACISLANRVASCMKERVGESIGYKISGDSNVRPGRTKMVYVTTGYLLQVLVNNPEQIRTYSHLILDEVHERDVDSDLLSLVVKLQMSGYGFKLVIMSATLQGDLFTRYFSDKKIKTIFVGVKRFPVEVVYIEQLLDRYGGRSGGMDMDGRRTSEAIRGVQAPFANQAVRAMRDAEKAFGSAGREAEGWEEEPAGKPAKGEFDDSDSDEDEDDEAAAAAAAAATAAKASAKKWRREVQPTILRGLDVLVYELVLRAATPGEGILVFLPGIGEISELYDTLVPLEDPEREQHMPWEPSVSRPDCRFKVFVLHSLIPKDEQEGAVFDAPPPDTAHVILASNIAESSLTIPKVRVVIDYGLRRQLVYDKRRHMSCLVTTWVSQASAKQRIGRTGRVFEGVAIRLFTKQFHDSYMEEFDPPEMQTAPLEKLYVNVKHLSAKLPEYQVTPTEKRKRTPKELLQLTAQPPSNSSIESSIEVLDQLGALTNASESAELTVLGYLMMSLPLDMQLCRLVIFGAMLDLPCEGVVIAAGCSVQDPFTLPSLLIIKDPREYATSLKRSYETRHYFDHGHCSEPLMLRSMFVHWLGEFRKMMVDRCGRRGYRSKEPPRAAFLRCAQSMAREFAIVPKRVVHLATSVLDTATRMRKFVPKGSPALKQLDGLVAILSGDKWFDSAAEAEEGLPKLEELFTTDFWKLKALLIMAFTPQFMIGSTKVRQEEPEAPGWDPRSWKRKPKKMPKEKSKLELLLDEFKEQGFAPERSVACVLEMPKGRSSMGPWHPRFGADVKATLDMITCGERFRLSLPTANRALLCFEEDEEDASPSRLKADALPVAKLDHEEGLVKDLPMGAHFIDLYGAGRWNFKVPLINSEKLERQKAEREREKAEKEKAIQEAKEREEKRKAEKQKAAAEAKEKKEREKAQKEAKEKAEKERLAREAEEKERAEREAREEAAREARRQAMALAFRRCPPEYFAKLHAPFLPAEPPQEPAKQEGKAPNSDPATALLAAALAAPAPNEGKEAAKQDAKAADGDAATALLAAALAVPAANEGKGSAPDASPAVSLLAASLGAPSPVESKDPMQVLDVLLHEHAPLEREEAALAEAEGAVDVPAEPEMEVDEPERQEASAPKAAQEESEEDLGPLLTVFKPVTPYEVNWEVVDQGPSEKAAGASAGKIKARPAKTKLAKGRCTWRNPMGFLGSCFVTGAMGAEPWPNDLLAVYTTLQGGDSKELSWVDGVTVLSAEGGGLLAFMLMITFLRHHQELTMDVDLQTGRIESLKGPGGLEFEPRQEQHLFVEDVKCINAVRQAVSEAFYTKAAPVFVPVNEDEGINFSGTRGRREDEPVPQIAETSTLCEAVDALLQVLREASERDNSMSAQEWQSRIVLRRPTVQTVDMHHHARAAEAPREGLFTLLLPLTDLQQVKESAEHAQREEDDRKRRDNDERRRRKEEEWRRREEEKRRSREEDQRLKAEARAQRQSAKKGGKAAAKGHVSADQWSMAHTPGRGGKGKHKGQHSQAAVPQQQHQQHGRAGGGGRGSDAVHTFPAAGPSSGARTMQNLPNGWTAVWDPNSERHYYWDRNTGEVTWDAPSSSGAAGSRRPGYPDPYAGQPWGFDHSFGMGAFGLAAFGYPLPDAHQ